MYYYVTELQSRPDGLVNSSITARSNFGLGLFLWHDRASKAAGSTDFTSVALTLQDQYGNIIKNEQIPTMYVAPSDTFEDD